MSHDTQENEFSKFLTCQEYSYSKALKEIQQGKKKSHWIWYIFPIIYGRRSSSISKQFGIKSLDEAKKYMQNDVLRNRLIEISEAFLHLETNDANSVLGSPDDEKVQACMTLFSIATPDNTVFQKVLDKYYKGEQDKKTLELLDSINSKDQE